MKAKFAMASMVLLLTGISQAETMLMDSGNAVDTITSLDQIEELIKNTQEQFWQVVPPSQDDPFYLHPENIVRVVDWGSADWPKKFLKRTYAEMRWVTSESILYPFYRITVVEERSGDIVYYNTYDQEVWRTSASEDYNPYLFAFLKYGVSSVEDLSAQQLLFGRSSNVGLEILMIPSDFASYYEAESSTDSVVMQLATASAVTTESSSLLLTTASVIDPPSSGGSSTNISTNVVFNSIVTNTFSVPSGFGQYAEIFRKDNLRASHWTVAENLLSVTGGTELVWADPYSSNVMTRFYILSDADIFGGADSDGDGYSDGREYYVTDTETNEFNSVDVDSDGLHDWFEVMLWGSVTNQDGTNDFDGDSLSNEDEMELTSTNVTFHSDPMLFDTDGGGIDDGFETTYTNFAFDPLDPADDMEDLDYDSLNNYEEYILGTDLNNQDTDGDGVNDGAEVEWAGYADSNGVSANPSVSNVWDWADDSDGDGVTFSNEVNSGGSPLVSDAYVTNNLVDVEYEVGDLFFPGECVWSWWMDITGERSLSVEVHGGIISGTHKFKKGNTYNVALWNRFEYDQFSLDYIATLSGQNVLIEDNNDPEIMGKHSGDTALLDLFWSGLGPDPGATLSHTLYVKMHIADIDLGIEGLDDPIEDEGEGLVMLVDDQAELTLHLAPSGLPENTSVELSVDDASKIRILSGSNTEEIGPNTDDSWVRSLGSCSLPESDINFWVEGVETGAVSIAMIYMDEDGEEVCRDTVNVTVSPFRIVKIPLGGSATLASNIIGKVYVPTMFGGDLTLSNGTVQLFYTDGADLDYETAAQIYNGDLDASMVAEGDPCTYEVEEDEHGWYYVKLSSAGSASIRATFVQMGEADAIPWNGWYWPYPNDQNPNLYDDDGNYTPLKKYDEVYGTHARANEEAYQPSPDADTGHCWGWALASVSITQPPETTSTNGVFFNQDEMEGLFTELADGS